MSYFSFFRGTAQGGFLLTLKVSVLVTAVINTEALTLLVNKNSCWKKGKRCYFVPRNLHIVL